MRETDSRTAGTEVCDCQGRESPRRAESFPGDGESLQLATSGLAPRSIIPVCPVIIPVPAAASCRELATVE